MEGDSCGRMDEKVCSGVGCFFDLVAAVLNLLSILLLTLLALALETLLLDLFRLCLFFLLEVDDEGDDCDCSVVSVSILGVVTEFTTPTLANDSSAADIGRLFFLSFFLAFLLLMLLRQTSLTC